ncbi:MAG: ribosome assembly cofactor RimP [Bacteroidales bacterium]|nr:ribosome assembly cofactor RimP [Bacteroidales bacterium]
MIDKLHILDVVDTALKGSDKFLVNLKVTTDNRIFVDIDGDNGVTIDDCVELSRTIEQNLNRDEEDFELNVASAGLDSPLKMPRQYKKNIGETLSVTTFDGEHVEGRLTEADDNTCTILPPKPKKGPAPEAVTFRYADVKQAKIVITF